MGSIGNFYDSSKAYEGHTSKTNALAITHSQSTETKISGSQMKRWANLILTGVAILGWIMILVIMMDAIFNNSKLIEWTMVKL